MEGWDAFGAWFESDHGGSQFQHNHRKRFAWAITAGLGCNGAWPVFVGKAKNHTALSLTVLFR